MRVIGFEIAERHASIQNYERIAKESQTVESPGKNKEEGPESGGHRNGKQPETIHRCVLLQVREVPSLPRNPVEGPKFKQNKGFQSFQGVIGQVHQKKLHKFPKLK